MQRKFLWLFAALGLLGLGPVESKAQAPASVAGLAAVITTVNGTPQSFAGSFVLIGSDTDNTYGAIALSGNATTNYGTYTYTLTGTNTATINYNNISSGISGNVIQLTFGTTTAGTAVLTSPSYPGQSLHATFVLYSGPAPASVQGWSFQLQIAKGLAPYAISGSPQIIVANSGDAYQFVNETGISNSTGTFAYATYPSASPSSSTLTLDDSILGGSYAQTFIWNNSTSGAYIVHNAATGGLQFGMFTGTPPVTFAVTPSAGANGSISPGSVQQIISGQPATFTATPNTGYEVDQWLVNGTVAQTGGSSFTTGAITAATNVSVTFQAVAVISISASPSSGGSVSGGGTFVLGDAVSVSATPNSGYVFIDWTEGSNVASTSPTYNFPANSNRQLVANFIALTPPTITSSATAIFALGKVGSFTLTAAGYPTPTFSAMGLPGWATFNATTGVISGNPTDASGTSYTITVTATNGNSPDASQTFTLKVLSPQTFGDWQTAFSTGGPTAFSQNDTVPNLFKFLFDINPNTPMSASDYAALPSFGTTTMAGKAYVTLTYRQYSLASNISINVQTSSDLQTWTTVIPPDFSQQMGNDPITGDPIIEVGVLANGTNKQFLRLDVTQP